MPQNITKTISLPEETSARPVETDEPRSNARRRMLKSGQICYNERHSTLECSVRDVSEHGARLRLSGSVDAPEKFELFIELDGTWVDCQVVWRSNNELGVLFTSEKAHVMPKRKQVLQQQHVKVVKPTFLRKPIR